MTITYNQIPNSLRVPFVAAEFDASNASQGPALLAYRALLIGQMLPSGTGLPNNLYRVTSPDQVGKLAGRGSIAHRNAIAYFKVNKSTETWLGLLEDDGAGVAASGTLTIAAADAGAGTIALYLGGERITVGVGAGATAASIATAVAAAINLKTDLPVTATSAATVVTVTHRHKGLVGNSYNIRTSYRDDESLPTGVTVTVVPLSGGTANPSLTDLIAALGDSWFHVVANPYTDATSLSALEDEFADRFGPMRMIDGVIISSAAGSFGTLVTLGNTRNSPHSVIVAQPGQNPLTPPSEFAAEVAGLVAYHGAAEPARPFQTLPLKHTLPPAEVDLFMTKERNELLFDGIATTRPAAGGGVQLERLITTYQTNASGSPSTAYLDLTTLLTLMYLRYSFRVLWQEKYPRHKLADDGTRLGAGQKVMTPKLGKSEAIGWFREMEEMGLVENFDQFKADIVVERNKVDPNRLDLLLPPDLINQLIGTAISIPFRL